ncbi:phosphotransferase family protein [Tessaracoccus caeni]|uniref:phosphotransferase family protein n=1 Tax=Tessaracoccus caeni TaxID=3031239 RepID=UPI0023DA8A13|nr:aminoglycoside phosphotransferase family protein [Tessaracoccus caeni]MDF1489037.1 aminoglycoside phosphotransferase family protein [Tessaracoccus caeni]
MMVEQTYAPAGPDEAAILAQFGLDETAFLGSGGEARVFALDDECVLRIQAPGDSPPDRELADLLDSWAGCDIGVELPKVLSQARRGSQNYNIERRLPGVPLSRWLAETPDPRRRQVALLSLLDVAARLRELPLPREGFGRVLHNPHRFTSLPELLAAQIAIGIHYSDGLLAQAVPNLDHQVSTLLDKLSHRVVTPAFCHVDLVPANVLVDDDGHLTAVLDVSVHALAADPVMDEVLTLAILEASPYDGSTADAAWLEDELRRRLGADAWLIDAYRRFYALYYAMDPVLIPWSASLLTRPFN